MNELFNTLKELILSSTESFVSAIANGVPTFFGAITMLLVGWVLARSLSFIIRKLLRNLKFDSLAERPPFAEYIERANIKTKPSQLVGKFVYWIIYLIFIVNAADTVGLDVVSEQFSRLIAFLPQLFSALVIFIMGLYVITFIRDFIRAATASLGMSAGKFISGIVFYWFFTMLILTTLGQIGVDTSVISDNLSIIIGAVLLSFAISYGFASREILSNILASFFSKRIFEIGQHIEMGDLRGEIIDIGTISIKIKTESEEIIVPTQQLINNQVKVIKK